MSDMIPITPLINIAITILVVNIVLVVFRGIIDVILALRDK